MTDLSKLSVDELKERRDNFLIVYGFGGYEDVLCKIEEIEQEIKRRCSHD